MSAGLRPAPPVRRIVIGTFRQLLRIYFRKVSVVGPVPAGARSRVLLPNHVNGLVDPLLVLATAETVVSPIGKAPLWRIPVLASLLDAIGAVPVVRRRDDPTKAAGSNDALFEQIGAHLAAGGNILIFPEGTSHNEPGLERMRSGPARMMERGDRARAATGTEPVVSFQAVGLEFEARDVFRSRVLVHYGPVRRFADVAPGGDAEARVKEATQLIEADLERLVLTAESWADRRLAQRVAALLATEDETSGTVDPSQAFVRAAELARAARDAAATLGDAAARDIDAVRVATTAYFDMLDRDGLADADVTAVDDRPLRRGRIGPATMLVALPLAAIGFVLYGLPYRVPRLLARGATADVASTYKLAAGLVLFPLWALGLSVAALFLPTRPFFPGVSLLAIALVWLSPLPALWWLDALDDGALRPRSPRALLKAKRDEALAAIRRVQARLEAQAAAPSTP